MQQLQHVAHAGLAVDRKREDDGPADQHRARTERERAQDVGTAPDAVPLICR